VEQSLEVEVGIRSGANSTIKNRVGRRQGRQRSICVRASMQGSGRKLRKRARDLSERDLALDDISRRRCKNELVSNKC